MSEHRIVVGVDGSEEAREALRWAAREAQVHGWTLDVVHAFDAPWHYWAAGAVPATPVPMDQVKEEQERLLAEEVRVACSEHGDLNTVSEVLNDMPARALVERSKGADMIVVGSRGRGGFAGLVLGSVSQQVVNHAKCPVVVMPNRERD